MNVKYTTQFLSKLEDLFAESDYHLRYEKGNFHSGYCLLNDTKIAIVNKYFPLEGKINCLVEILRAIEPERSKFSEKNLKLFLEITQTELPI